MSDQRMKDFARGKGPDLFIKSSDRKSTMFEYGTKEQQESEITKPRSLPILATKQRDRRPKRLKESTVKEPLLSGEDKVKWEEAKRQAAVKAVDGLLNKAKRKGRPLPPSQLREALTEPRIQQRMERKARLRKQKSASSMVKKAKEEEKHYGTHYGTKDPKGSTRRIAEYKTKGGKIKSPPDSPKGREEMASEMIAHHHHHLGRHPGGRAQAIAIGLRQAGMSRDQTRKAMGNTFIQESAEARLGEMFGSEPDLSPIDLMKSMTLASESDVTESLREIDKAMGEGDAVKAYVGFKKLTQKIAARGGVNNPAAVAAAISREKLEKGNPGGMSGYEKGVAMYGAEGMKKMAQGHLTSSELQRTKKATPEPIPAMKAMGKQEEEEFVPKDKPEISKQMPSVGTGIGGASGARPSVGTGLGKSKGDEKKAYLGEFKPGSGFTGSGAAPAGYKPGSGQAVGEAAAEKMSPSTAPHERPGFTPPKLSGGSKPPAVPGTEHVGTSGGSKIGGKEGGPHIFTSAAPEAPAVAKPSLKPGSTLAMTSVAKPGSEKSMKKAMDDLMAKAQAHGGKGPAKTGAGEVHYPNAGPARTGKIEWDEEENQAGSGRAQTGAGTPHPPNAGPAQTGAGERRPPNAGPAQMGAGEVHMPGREVSKAMMASSIPRMPRGMAASMDTWRSATSVLTRTNAMLHPQAPLTPDPLADAGGRPSTHTGFYKSDLMSCENCGRTFAKSHGECPTCSMNKALTCKSCGSSMHKGRDGELKCSVCGQGVMKSAYDIGPSGMAKQVEGNPDEGTQV